MKSWFKLDDDRWCRKVNKKRFKFIQPVWLDTCEDDPRAVNAIDDTDNYVICAMDVDLRNYDTDEIENYISGYYEDLDHMLTEFEDDEPWQEMAEIIFECSQTDTTVVSDLLSYTEVADFIRDYIREN